MHVNSHGGDKESAAGHRLLDLQHSTDPRKTTSSEWVRTQPALFLHLKSKGCFKHDTLLDLLTIRFDDPNLTACLHIVIFVEF